MSARPPVECARADSGPGQPTFERRARVLVATAELARVLEDEFEGGWAAASPDEVDAFVIGESEGRLDLRPPGESGRPGIRAHFPPDRFEGRGRPPLVRAFGKTSLAILDWTAGLGGDAYRLAAAGHRVHAFERHPAVHAVLASGWQRDRADGAVPADLIERLDFSFADALNAHALDGLGGQSSSDPASAIYIDPMYPPPRKASALPRRELQVLRALLGQDEDAEALVTLARARSSRVVVKRPHHAKPLAADPSFVVESKLVRFDVYLDAGRAEAHAK